MKKKNSLISSDKVVSLCRDISLKIQLCDTADWDI